MWNTNVYGVNNTSTRLNVYLISPKSGTPVWPVTDAQLTANGFKKRFRGEWLPQFYKLWKIIKVIKVRPKVRGAPQVDTQINYNNQLHYENSFHTIKIKYNKKVAFGNDAVHPSNLPSNLKPVYAYAISNCPAYPFQGRDTALSTADTYVHKYRISTTSYMYYKDP